MPILPPNFNPIPNEEPSDPFAPTLPSQPTSTTPGGSQAPEDDYRSLAERYGLPTMNQLENYDIELDSLSAQLQQAGIDTEDLAVATLLAEPAFQEVLTGANAPGMISWLRETYPAAPTTDYDQAVIASGFTGEFTPPAGPPNPRDIPGGGGEFAVAQMRKDVPKYEENEQTGWRRYRNGVLVSPDGQVAFDPTSTAPGTLKWQRDVVSKWNTEQVEHWSNRLVEMGYLTKDQAKKVTKDDPGFLNALSNYHISRYIYGKPVNGELSGVGAAGSDKPPLVDYEDMAAQTRNFVREHYRRVFGEDPTDGEVVAFTDAIIKQAMELQRRYRRKGYSSYSGDAATEAGERFIERLETSPQAEFLRDSEEENTALRDALQQAVVVTNSLAG